MFEQTERKKGSELADMAVNNARFKRFLIVSANVRKDMRSICLVDLKDDAFCVENVNKRGSQSTPQGTTLVCHRQALASSVSKVICVGIFCHSGDIRATKSGSEPNLWSYVTYGDQWTKITKTSSLPKRCLSAA